MDTVAILTPPDFSAAAALPRCIEEEICALPVIQPVRSEAVKKAKRAFIITRSINVVMWIVFWLHIFGFADRPLLLIGISPKTAFLQEASTRISFWPFFLVGALRLALFCPYNYIVGVGATELYQIERESGRYPRLWEIWGTIQTTFRWLWTPFHWLGTPYRYLTRRATESTRYIVYLGILTVLRGTCTIMMLNGMKHIPRWLVAIEKSVQITWTLVLIYETQKSLMLPFPFKYFF